MNNDIKFMNLAIKEIYKCNADTYKNPCVGAVVTKNDKVLSKGHTHSYGNIHAERDALKKLSLIQARNSTLYVTLEPCDHYGKQPPCTNLILKYGIRRVVIAMLDPNPLVSGKGIKKLRKNGVQVDLGLCKKEVSKLNLHYNFFFKYGYPWIAIKQAISLDHKVTAHIGSRTLITNKNVYNKVHYERGFFQGIVIGSNTAIIDNPTLLTNQKLSHLPIRIVLDRQGRLLKHPNLSILKDKCAPTWIFTQNCKLSHLINENVNVFVFKNCEIKNIVNFLTKRGIQSLYVEGGPKIHKAFIDSGMVTEIITYISPIMIGNSGLEGFIPDNMLSFDKHNISILDNNIRVDERVCEYV